MRHARPQPGLARGLTLLWFPVFFAAVLGVLALASLTQPRPHEVRLGVVAPPLTPTRSRGGSTRSTPRASSPPRTAPPPRRAPRSSARTS